MRKVFHFVSAFGAGIATFMGIEPDDVAKDDLRNEKEISVDSENQNNSGSDQFDFPISESLLNGDNNDEVLENNNENEVVEIITPDAKEIEKSESDLLADQNKLDEEKRLKEMNAALLAQAENDSSDTEIPKEFLDKMDSAELAVVKEEYNIYRDLEVSGLIMDETRTKIGRDFYDAFVSDWNARPQINSYYSIVIEEKPVRGSVSQISIKVNETEVMRSFVQLRNSEIEEMANRAVYRVQKYLANEDEMRNRLLEESDQMGSGIF